MLAALLGPDELKRWAEVIKEGGAYAAIVILLCVLAWIFGKLMSQMTENNRLRDEHAKQIDTIRLAHSDAMNAALQGWQQKLNEAQERVIREKQERLDYVAREKAKLRELRHTTRDLASGLKGSADLMMEYLLERDAILTGRLSGGIRNHSNHRTLPGIVRGAAADARIENQEPADDEDEPSDS